MNSKIVLFIVRPFFAQNPNPTYYTLFDRLEPRKPNLDSDQLYQAPNKSLPFSLSIYNIFVVLGSKSQLRSIQLNTK